MTHCGWSLFTFCVAGKLWAFMISCYRQIVSGHDILFVIPANCERSWNPSCVTGQLWAVMNPSCVTGKLLGVMISFWCYRQIVSGHDILLVLPANCERSGHDILLLLPENCERSWYPSWITGKLWAVTISFLCKRQNVRGNDIHLVLLANCERYWYPSYVTRKLWAVMISLLCNRQIVSGNDILLVLPASCKQYESAWYPSCVLLSNCERSWYPSCVTSKLWAAMISFLCN